MWRRVISSSPLFSSSRSRLLNQVARGFNVWQAFGTQILYTSYDPGVSYVLQSIFSFDLSLPLNFLLEGFDNRILVIQGMNDPLYDSKSKLAMFKKHCRGVVTKEIYAGHCPHDEEPNEVNCIIKEWVATLESKVPSVP